MVEGAVQDGQVPEAEMPSPAGRDFIGAAGDVDEALGGVLGVFGVDAVLAGGDGEGAVGDADAVLAAEALFRRR
jgi:hypothetical protein